MADVAKLDLYGILEVSPDSTEKQIVKAYRKKALKCHPDKNPDNPKAAELFHQLSKALEVLTDAAARAAYDKVLKAKKAAELRHRVLDSKRKKFKEDLDAREKAAEQQRASEVASAKNLEEEIDRLRKEGSRLLKEEQERLKEELETPNSNKPEGSDVSPRLKVKWKAKKDDPSNGGYSYETLKEIFSKYGEVTALLVSSKKNGSAVVEFASAHSGVLAVQSEIGKPSNPLTLTWLSGQPATTVPSRWDTQYHTGSANNPASSTYAPPSSAERDFESLVMMKMRQAEERKKLIEQMQKEDEEEGT